MADKRMTPAQVVAHLQDGMTIGIGGWATRRKPMALVREILRSPLKDLTLVAYGGPEIGMLCAAGKVKRVIFGFVSLDVQPFDNHFRNARQAGQVEASELDEGMVQWGLRAAGMRLPFLPTRVGLGTDVLKLNPWLGKVRSPFADGEELVAVPAIKLDAALLHVSESDEKGNCTIQSPDPFFDDLFARAAKQVFISCERVVPTAKLINAQTARLQPFERSLVTGVVELPYGAHPTASAPFHGIDVKHLAEYNAAATPEGWADYRTRYVDLPDHDSYVRACGGYGRLAGLSLPVF